MWLQLDIFNQIFTIVTSLTLTNYINVTASQLFEINLNIIFYSNIYYLLEYPNRRNLFTHFSINTQIYKFLNLLFMKHILLFKEYALPYVN